MSHKPGKNKGEISEFYVFLVALRDGKIPTTIKDEKTKSDVDFVIDKVIHGAREAGCIHVVDHENRAVNIEKDHKIIDVILHETVENDAKTVLSALRGKCVGGTLNFDADEMCYRYHVYAPSGSKTKEDIILGLYDNRYGTNQTLPFSIKSYIGGNPTLLNASHTTNIIYRIEGNLSSEDVREINSMTVTRDGEPHTDVQGRFNAIFEKGCALRFERMENPVFFSNLILIDSSLPEIIGALLIERYKTKVKNLKELIEILKEKNPLKFEGKQEFYKVKICRLLMNSFTGLKPGEVWNGYDSVHGGYIEVQKNGDILCNPLTNRNVFEEYLLTHTYLETPSTKRHEFGKIVEDLEGWTFTLNFDVRMKN